MSGSPYLPALVTIIIAIAVVYTVPKPVPYSNEVEDARVCGMVKSTNYVIYSKNVVTPQGVIAASIKVKDGKISQVLPSSKCPLNYAERKVIDFSDKVILPGLIDVHSHLNDPGRESWEGFYTGTRAAAAGGFTTLVDMPLNSIPSTVSVHALNLKLAASEGKLHVDTAFWGGLVPDNHDNHTALGELAAAGVLGFKAFMSPTGTDEFSPCGADKLRAALPVMERTGLPLVVHAEDPPEDAAPPSGPPREHSSWLNSRPREWEQKAIRKLIGLSKDHPKATIHVAHLSDADSVAMLREARAAGQKMSVETCPHYLVFAHEEVPEGDTRFKCAPPIRQAENRDRLWAALQEGVIDMVATDHSPAPLELKRLQEGDFLTAWGGISGLQMALPATWTAGLGRNVSYEDIARWWSAAPAGLAGLSKTKGSIEAGKDADLVVWEPELAYDTRAEYYHAKHKVSPYMDMPLKGYVWSTFVRGQEVYSNAQFSKPCGKSLLRNSWGYVV